MTAKVVRVDFNNSDAEAFVRLNTRGAIEDLSHQGILLVEGHSLLVTDGEIQVSGTIRKPGAEGVWRLQVDWAEVFRLHAGRGSET